MQREHRWAALVVTFVWGCGGAAPLLHPAHALGPEEVTVGAGFSGQLAVAPATASTTADQVLEEAAFSPGLAPWVGGRVGLGSEFDAGLTYTGRAIRVDARRAFEFDGTAVSIGVGASGVLPKRRDDLGIRVGGGGGDVPIIVGMRSDSDIYAGWIGARGGFELLRGHRELPVEPTGSLDDPLTEDVSGWHVQAGGLVGMRVGFRYVFAVLELDAAMHWAEGDIGEAHVKLHRFGLAPAGAVVGRF